LGIAADGTPALHAGDIVTRAGRWLTVECVGAISRIEGVYG
jgi:hypothetical protein